MLSNDSIHFVQGKNAEKRQSRLGGLGQLKPFVFELNAERKRRVIRSVTEQSCAVIKSEFAENR